MVVQGTSFGGGGELQGSLECAGFTLRFGCRERSSNPLFRVDCQFSRSLQERRRGGDAAARLGSTGRHLQVGCHVVVGVPGGLRPVPGAAVTVDPDLGCLSERAVRVASLGR